MSMKQPNASIYANKNLGRFFKGYPANLTGQCVSLVKWFLQDMTSVPNPQTARGHAKDFGDTLVAQGHAKKVSSALRKRGDLVVWKQDGGGYGHIGVLTDKNHVFEENVGLAGTSSKLVSGVRVYASRIDPLWAFWRVGKPTFYRVKSYKEAQRYVVQYNNVNFRKRPTTKSGVSRNKNKGYQVWVREWVRGESIVAGNLIRPTDKWAKVWKKDFVHKSLIRRK